MAGRAKYDPPPGELALRDFFYIRPYPYYRELFTMLLEQGEERQATERIQCPVLVLHGTEDDIVPLKDARGTPAMMPNASPLEMHVLDGFAHAMAFDHGPEVAALMVKFTGRHLPADLEPTAQH